MDTATLSVKRAAATLIAFLIGTLGAAEVYGAPGSFDLVSPTNGAWCTATCTFTWQSASSATSYDLYVDGALKHAAAATTTCTLAAGEVMADGWHTWSVVAKDGSGAATSSTSTFSVRVDASPPTAPGLTSPAANAWVGSTSPTLSWLASTDTGSGLSGYEIWLNNAAVMTNISSSATSASMNLPTTIIYDKSFASVCPGDWQWTSGTWYCGYAAGGWHLSLGNGDSPPYGTATMANVMDLSNAGHAELRIYHKWLNQSSTLEINASTDGGTSWQRVAKLPLNATGNNSQQNTFALDNTIGTTSAKVQLGGKVSSGEGWSVDWLSVHAVLGGPYTWQVVAVDAAGNRTGSEIRQLQYDLPPLPFALVSPPGGTWVASSSPTFAWNATSDAGSGLAKYQIWIDGKLAVDNIPPSATTATTASALADGAHTWQVYALDAAGALRRSSQTLGLGVDTTPPQSFGIDGQVPGLGTSSTSWGLPCEQTYTIPTPSLSWNSSNDAGSGIDHYQLIIDGTIARDSVATVSATPSSPLAEGVHSYTVTAFDKVRNHTSSSSCRLVVDFNPPSAFELVSPVDNGGTIPVVNTLTPTFTWEPSASTGSGVDHYELYVTDPTQSANLVCVECSIPATSTSVTITKPVTAGIHGWNVRAVDHVGGFVWGNAGQEGTRRFNAKCIGACGSAPETAPESGPEIGPEPAAEAPPEPSRDAGIDLPIDIASDASTATSTVTATGTSTATTTSTATGTSVSPEPRPDGSPAVGTDAPIFIADAGASDLVGARDGLLTDGPFSSADAWMATPAPDAATGSNLPDGGLGLADALVANTLDAKVAGSDGHRSGSVDGAGYDAGVGGKNNSSGCGCAVGGHDARTAWGLPMIVLGLLAFWRGSRPRRRRPLAGQG